MFYVDCHNEWYQGDIVASLPIIVTDLEHERSSSNKLFTKPALTISQTCDLQRRPFVQICPIHSFAYLKQQLLKAGKSEQGAESYMEAIRNRTGVSYYFYLPPEKEYGIDEGYADLGFVSTLALKQLTTLPRIATLNDHPRHILASQVGILYLRPH